jgi:hypothetical protein
MKPTLQLEGTDIKEVESHKHLGITLQSNGKWSAQIRETKSKAQKRVDILRGYMYKLDRDSLEKLYLTYIRPILEYSDVVWDNCTLREKQDLEGIQLSAARVVTGGKKGTEHRLLYNETQWEKLEHNHNVRSREDLTQPKVTSTLMQKSFFPETTKL